MPKAEERNRERGRNRDRERDREELVYPPWAGPELAMEAVEDRLKQIRLVLQPPRPDIIYSAATEALFFMEQLEQWLHAQPPASIYFQHTEKRLPPVGGRPSSPGEEMRELQEQWTGER